MASQRHKREQFFFKKAQVDGDPRQPRDSSEETATMYGEEAAWPDADRHDDVVVRTGEE